MNFFAYLFISKLLWARFKWKEKSKYNCASANGHWQKSSVRRKLQERLSASAAEQ